MKKFSFAARSAQSAAALTGRAFAGSLFILLFALGATDASAKDVCTQTAKSAYKACGFEAKDDYWTALGKCVNEADPKACIQTAREEQRSKKEECKERFDARKEVCALVGGEAYNPPFDSANFVDPGTINAGNANPYFPLIVGHQWTYEGADETIVVTVTDKSKLIQGVTCRVVNDVVSEDGKVIEDTNDWFAQDLAGNVWYCGEEVKDYETFEGDDPEEAELVSIDGSFKVGRDGAKPGIVMLADPQVGDAYRQEALLGEAEDVAEVVSLTGNEMVPAAACSNDCLVTREFTPLEPGGEEFKHFQAGTGLILEVDAEGNRVELVDFTVVP